MSGIDIFSLFDTQRIHKLVEKWRELEEKKQNIFQPKIQLQRIVDQLFYEKRIQVDDRNQISFVNETNSTVIPAADLSSGEKQILILLTEALLQEQSPTIYLADEPELSLHIDWQEILVDSILALNPNAQIVFATHSPDIISHYNAGVLHMETH